MRKFLKATVIILALAGIPLGVLAYYNDVFFFLGMIWLVLLHLFFVIKFLYLVLSPKVKVKAIVLNRPGVGFLNDTEHITFVLPNGENVKLMICEGKCSPIIKVGDAVILEYKGDEIRSIKKIKPAQKKII